MGEQSTAQEAGREIGQALGEVASEWLPVVAEFLDGILEGIAPMTGTILAQLWEIGTMVWDFAWAVVSGMIDGAEGTSASLAAKA